MAPLIHLRFFIVQNRIQQVMLLLSSSFRWSVEGQHTGIDRLIEQWLESYLSKQEPKEMLPLSLDRLPPFTRNVLEQLQKVPFGQCISYRELAMLVQNPTGARAVGNACGRNPLPLIIPCHRVLTSDQRLGGFSQGLEIKRQLLAFEGHTF